MTIREMKLQQLAELLKKNPPKDNNEPWHIGNCKYCKHRDGVIWFRCKLTGKLVSPTDACGEFEERQ